MWDVSTKVGKAKQQRPKASRPDPQTSTLPADFHHDCFHFVMISIECRRVTFWWPLAMGFQNTTNLSTGCQGRLPTLVNSKDSPKLRSLLCLSKSRTLWRHFWHLQPICIWTENSESLLTWSGDYGRTLSSFRTAGLSKTWFGSELSTPLFNRSHKRLGWSSGCLARERFEWLLMMLTLTAIGRCNFTETYRQANCLLTRTYMYWFSALLYEHLRLRLTHHSELWLYWIRGRETTGTITSLHTASVLTNAGLRVCHRSKGLNIYR